MSAVGTSLLRANLVHAAGLRGDGQVIAVCDTGLDTGIAGSLHAAFGDRVRELRSFRDGGMADDPNGHGTHVAACIVGDTTSTGGSILGTAPGAELILQSVFDDHSAPFGNMPSLPSVFLAQAHDLGARVHSNSWCLPQSNLYTVQAQDIDQFVWERRDMVVVASVGNEGRFQKKDGTLRASTACTPGVARNCISVGASESSRIPSGTYRDFYSGLDNGKNIKKRTPASVLDDQWADDVDVVAPFSGRGPAEGGQIQPDLVAPGTAILSARSSKGFRSSVWGDAPNPTEALLGGTSTATPLVAGCAALVRQSMASDKGISNPSAALVKAVLIAGALPIQGPFGQPGDPSVPDNSQGWGRVDLFRSLRPQLPLRLSVLDEQEPLTPTSGPAAFNVQVLQPGLELTVALVWTDRPGIQLQSDLDLIVKADGQECHGNQPIGSPAFDRDNNVERVRLPSVTGPQVTIEVHPHRIADVAQPFAVAVIGAVAP